jgi:predicted GIY-YIG superfamily endonuclease
MAWEHTEFTTNRATAVDAGLGDAPLPDPPMVPLEVPAVATTHYYLYVLQLGDGRLYTGITNSPHHRINEHYSGVGASFTEKYGVLGLVSAQDLGEMTYQLALEREDMKTLELMCKYSYHWVRGGHWVMDDDQDVLTALSAEREAIASNYHVRVERLIQ